jgi:tetratricopeptide (TPR) repeat protein/DNA-binding CsgD family transcriptional regulator
MGSFLTPVFVGRQQELNHLEAALAAARTGVGRCVILRGEAGIGKSRLLAEIRGRVVDRGFTILVGRCFEQDMAFPYAPLIDLLRTYMASHGLSDLLAALGSDVADVAKLLPELAHDPSVASHLAGSQATPPLDSEVEKRRLFEALTGLFLQQAGTGPLLLIIEDLHWSDQASLEFLLYLVRRMADQSMLLLLSARSSETQPGMVELLAGLDREPIAQEIRLAPLTRADVADLLKAILDQPEALSAEFVTAIYSLTEGNPFFAEEIFTSLIASGDIYSVDGQWRRKPLAQLDIPDSIQRLVQQRLDHLSQPARRLLDLAAVSGRSFDFVILQALTGHSDGELLVLVKELMTARLVIEESADQFTFRHALTREALYTRLLARERQTMHGQIAQAVEELQAGALEAQLEALAYHFFEAAMWPKALDYAQRAGEKALALYAPHAAVEQFTRAINAAGHLSSKPPAALYRLRGQAFDTLGEFDRARADYEAALQAARAAGDQRAAWQALHDLGLLWAARDYERTGDYCRQALELARSMEDAAAIGHSLNRLGNWLMNNGRPFEALDDHREALDLFEALDDRAGLAATLDLLGMTSNMCGDAEGTVTYYERAIPILRELNDRQTLASSLANVVMYTRNLEQAYEAVKLAHDIGWRSGEAYALGTLSQALFTLGRYGEALTIRTQSLEIAQAIEHPQWMASGHIYLGLLHVELLALARAEEQLEQGLTLARQVGSTFFVWLGSGGLASVYILQGRLEAAETLLAELPQDWIPTLFWARLAQVELALARQDAARMLQLLDDPLNALPAPKKAIGIVAFAYGPALTLQGQALTLQGRLDEAEQVLHRARTMYTTYGIAQSLWKIHLALGKLYLAAGRPDEAEEAFAAARAQVDELAATLTDEELRETFRRRANTVIPPAQPLTPRQAAKEEFGGLTRRKRQVAAVVAQGLSNQDIADELVVSVKTVEAHVTRILSKLGFSSRAQIAAWAVGKGLAPAPQDLDNR